MVDVIRSIVILLSRCCLPNDEGQALSPQIFFLEPPLHAGVVGWYVYWYVWWHSTDQLNCAKTRRALAVVGRWHAGVVMCPGVYGGTVMCHGPPQLHQVVCAMVVRVMSAGSATKVRWRGRATLHVLQRDLQQPRSHFTHAADRQHAQSTLYPPLFTAT